MIFEQKYWNLILSAESVICLDKGIHFQSHDVIEDLEIFSKSSPIYEGTCQLKLTLQSLQKQAQYTHSFLSAFIILSAKINIRGCDSLQAFDTFVNRVDLSRLIYYSKLATTASRRDSQANHLLRSRPARTLPGMDVEERELIIVTPVSIWLRNCSGFGQLWLTLKVPLPVNEYYDDSQDSSNSYVLKDQITFDSTLANTT